MEIPQEGFDLNEERHIARLATLSGIEYEKAIGDLRIMTGNGSERCSLSVVEEREVRDKVNKFRKDQENDNA